MRELRWEHYWGAGMDQAGCIVGVFSGMNNLTRSNPTWFRVDDVIGDSEFDDGWVRIRYKLVFLATFSSY